MTASKRDRPVFLDLAKIRLPVGALTSILHRATGILLAAGVAFGIDLLDRSLRGPQAYAEVGALFENLAFRIVVVVFVWALAHHLLAGARHLLSDIDIGSQLPAARRSAWAVNVLGVAVALLAGAVLL